MKDEDFARAVITLQEGVIDPRSLGVIDEAYEDSRDSIYRMNKLLEAAVKGINALWAEIRKRDNIIANYRQQIERDKLIHRAAPHGGDPRVRPPIGERGQSPSGEISRSTSLRGEIVRVQGGGDKLRKKARAVRRPVDMEVLGVAARRGGHSPGQPVRFRPPSVYHFSFGTPERRGRGAVPPRLHGAIIQREGRMESMRTPVRVRPAPTARRKEAARVALAAYMYDSSSGQKWFSFKGPGGSVTERAVFESKARRAAADRLGCDESELICTDITPVKIYYK